MPIIRATVVIPTASTLPRDNVTNTFHFWTDTSLVVASPDIADRLETFYDSCFDLAGTASNSVSWVDAVVNTFWLDDPTPRVPIITPIDIAPTSPAATILPPEVACVSSIAAPPTTGIRVQSLRNRVYLPGIGDAAMFPGSTTYTARLDGTFCDNVRSAATALLGANTSDLQWVGYSQALVGNPTFPDGSWPIARGWIDQEPDTQRRRQTDEGVRYGWTAP